MIYDDANKRSLGYVNAKHQALGPHSGQLPKATVLTHYLALGVQLEEKRQLLQSDWRTLANPVITALEAVHPDLQERLRGVHITRYGHAMAVPVASPQAVGPAPGLPDVIDARIRLAHSDWAGYSIFEEAFEQGYKAALNLIS